MANDISISNSSSNANFTALQSVKEKTNPSNSNSANEKIVTASTDADKSNSTVRRSKKMRSSRAESSRGKSTDNGVKSGYSSKSGRSDSAYSVEISKKGARAAKNDHIKSEEAPKSHEKSSRNVRLDMGNVLDKYRKGGHDQFKLNALKSDDDSKKGILSSIKEMYTKRFEEEKEIVKPTNSSGQIVINGQDAKTIDESNGQVVVKASKPAGENEAKGIFGSAASPLKQNNGIGLESAPLSPPAASKPMFGDAGTASPLNRMMAHKPQNDIEIKSPMETMRDKQDDDENKIKSPMETMQDKDDKNDINIKSTPGGINNKPGDDKEEKNVKAVPPGLENKDAVENNGVGQAKQAGNKPKPVPPGLEKKDVVENNGVGQTKQADNEPKAVPPGLEKKDGETDHPSVAINKAKVNTNQNKTENLPPGQLKKEADNASGEPGMGAQGIGQAKKFEQAEFVEKEFDNVKEPITAANLFMQPERDSSFQPQSAVGLKGVIRVNGEGGHALSSSSGAVIHMGGDENTSKQGSLSMKSGTNLFSSMMSETPYGKNTALSIYRGVQSYVG